MSASRSIRRKPLAVFVQLALPTMFAISLAQANTCLVNSNGDDPGDGSTTGASTITSTSPTGTLTLRDCIVAANLMTGSTGAPNGSMAITFDGSVFTGSAANTIALASDLPLIFNNLSIDASGLSAPVTIDGGAAHRIFFVSGLPSIPVTGLPAPDDAQVITAALSNLVLQNGKAKGGDGGQAGGGMGAGGALFINQFATVNLSSVNFANNSAQGGASVLSNAPGGPGGGGGGSGSGGGGLGGGATLSTPSGGGGIGNSGSGRIGGSFGGTGIGQISTAQAFGPGFGGGGYVCCAGGANGGGIGGGGSGAYSFTAGGGGFGGGGGASGEGGGGGAGGFGGGGGSGSPGGAGGFGGGGGANGAGGQGGFGGGGGGANTSAAVAGGVGGGIAGGSGGIPQGGGGAGFGGAVFVRPGGSLTVQSAGTGTLSGDSITAGTGFNSGAAAGNGAFLMSGATTTFNIAGTYTVSDNLQDDSAASLPGGTYTAGNGAGASITKQGAGTLVLGGSLNQYSGTTTINAGSLQLDGSLTASPITINAGGSLNGVGNDPQSATLNSGGFVEPGDAAVNPGPGALSAPGTLHLGGLNWNGGGIMNFQLGDSSAPGNSDALVLNSFLNKSSAGTYKFHFTDGTGGPPTLGATYTLIALSFTGFAETDFSFDYSGAFSGTFGGTFKLNNIPPPKPLGAPTPKAVGPLGTLTFTVNATTPVTLQSFSVD